MNETGKGAKGPERPLAAVEAELWTELCAGAPHPLMGPRGGCEGTFCWGGDAAHEAGGADPVDVGPGRPQL